MYSHFYVSVDDACICLEYERGNLLSLEKLFDQIELEIDLKINHDKTDILHVGSIRNSECKLITQKSLYGLIILLEC